MNVRRTAALLTVTAALAAPATSAAKPIGHYGAPNEAVGPSVSAPSPSSSDDNTVSVVLLAGALAIAVGGAAYSSRVTLSQVPR